MDPTPSAAPEATEGATSTVAASTHPATAATAVAANAAAMSARLKAVLSLLATSLQHERFEAAITAFVTDLAIRTRCDRVSLGFVHRRQVRIRAMSHTAHFVKNAGLVQAVESAMEESIDQEATVNFPAAAEAEGTAFRITRLHDELGRRYGSSSICSIPFFMNGELLGVLTLERSAAPPFDTEIIELLEAAMNMAGPLLHLKRREEMTLIGRSVESTRWLLGRTLGPGHLKWKIACLLVAGLTVFLCFAKAEYKIASRAIVEGAIQQAAVAPFDGYIKSARFRAGDVVESGQVLCELDDREYRLEHLKWKSKHEQMSKQHQQALAQLDAAQIKIIAAQIEQAQAQIHLTEAHLERTQIEAPFPGVVVAGDLSQSIGAPVQRGDVLFEIAPLDRYRLVLHVDERDIGEVALGQSGDIVLAALPGEPHPFVVEKVTPISSTADGLNYFRVEASLSGRADARVRPGMEGVAKVRLDRRHLVWIWTHKTIDWVRITLWHWLP